jgi:hypothetical protein
MDVTIPASTTATVHVPVKDVEAGKARAIRTDNGASVCAVESEQHRFRAAWP